MMRLNNKTLEFMVGILQNMTSNNMTSDNLTKLLAAQALEAIEQERIFSRKEGFIFNMPQAGYIDVVCGQIRVCPLGAMYYVHVGESLPVASINTIYDTLDKVIPRYVLSKVECDYEGWGSHEYYERTEVRTQPVNIKVILKKLSEEGLAYERIGR